MANASKIALLLLVSSFAFAQGGRYDNFTWSVGPAVPGTSLGTVVAIPGAKINVCESPANATPCTNYATTYTDTTLAVPCSNSTQVVLAGTSLCLANSDAYGNFGFYAAPGTYAYTVTYHGSSVGPYPIVIGINDGSSPSFATAHIGTGGVTGIAGEDIGNGPIPLGNDVFLYGRGPADGLIGNIPYSITSTTVVNSTGVHSIAVSSTASLYTNIPSTPTGLVINRFQADAEALLAGSVAQCAGFTPTAGLWCIQDSTHIIANFQHTHVSTPYTVDQAGAGLVRAYVLAHDAQDGSHLWFCQQDTDVAPLHFSCWIGDGSYSYMSYDGTNMIFRATNYLADGIKNFGLFFTTTQAVLKTGAGDSTYIKDANDVQQARFSNSLTYLPALDVNSSVATIDNTGKGTFNGGLKAGASGSTVADTRKLVQAVYDCGTTTTCANTTNLSEWEIRGTVPLSSASPSTAVVTGISPTFTSTSTYSCICSPVGTTAVIAAGGCGVSNTSTSSITLTGPNTVTTVMSFSCKGH